MLRVEDRLGHPVAEALHARIGVQPGRARRSSGRSRMSTLFQVEPSVTLNQPMKRTPYFSSVSRARFGKRWRIPRLKIASRPLRTLKKVTISGISAGLLSVIGRRPPRCVITRVSGFATPVCRPRPPRRSAKKTRSRKTLVMLTKKSRTRSMKSSVASTQTGQLKVKRPTGMRNRMTANRIACVTKHPKPGPSFGSSSSL